MYTYTYISDACSWADLELADTRLLLVHMERRLFGFWYPCSWGGHPSYSFAYGALHVWSLEPL